MGKANCIDVSTWQKNVDYKKVKAAGITAVIIRAGFGNSVTQKDNEFETHYKNAKAAGLKIGAYWYSYGSGVADAEREAQACIAILKGKPFDLPVYYDMEENSTAALGKTTCTNMAVRFCDTVKAAGYRVGVYANPNWFYNYLDYSLLKSKYSIWLAHWNSSHSLACDIWQYGYGSVSGVSGDCDCNVIENSSVVANSTNEKVLDSSGYERGDKSTGVLALKELLMLAKQKKIITQGMDENGIFGDGTYLAVNQVLKKGGYKQNGIAGNNLVKYLTKLLREKI